MTDQTIPDVTDDDRSLAREWAAFIESDTLPWAAQIRAAARVILNDIPAPPRPTLADMTPGERIACRWMQADVKPGGLSDVKSWGRCVIITPHDEDSDTGLISADGKIVWASSDRVTPRPDLPRLEWPEATATGPDHLAVGTVIESAADPRLDALPDGSVLRDCNGETVAKRSGEWVGIGYIPIPSEGAEFGPWKVMRIGWEDDQ